VQFTKGRLFVPTARSRRNTSRRKKFYSNMHHTALPRTLVEKERVEGSAGVTELYRCKECSQITRFPRYILPSHVLRAVSQIPLFLSFSLYLSLSLSSISFPLACTFALFDELHTLFFPPHFLICHSSYSLS
jgi:hypothetical protein